MAAKAKDMPRDVYDQALRDAIDAEISRRRPVGQWTLDIDREIWRAAEVYRMGARAIAVVMAPIYPWATRNTVEVRLSLIRKHGGPDGVPR